ncbi:MAG: hypothetical protein IJL30_09255 [Clostridia bacterium]|nr:hypothetical protein [Clostridia bacterium]
MTVNFDDGKAAATITVILNQQQVENPETGDDESDTYGFVTLAALFTASLGIAAAFIKRKTAKR